jgi:MFS family permease
MTVQTTFEDGAVRREAPAWGAVFALTLCVATLIASEFMPVSLLTPIAADLHITEGQAGQAIAVSGMFAVLASLLVSRATCGIDRRIVLLSLTVLMMASGLIVALAPNEAIFMAGRALIGIVIGGFWSMSAATAMFRKVRSRGRWPSSTAEMRWRRRLPRRWEAFSVSISAGGEPSFRSFRSLRLRWRGSF